MFPSVVYLVKDQYINRKKIDEILRQKHLLSETDIIAVLLAKFSDKISKIYCNGGLFWYHTDVHTKRKKHDLNGKDFTPEKFKINQYNVPYDEVFLSYIKVNGEDYYIEHNLEFSKEEIIYLKELKFLS